MAGSSTDRAGTATLDAPRGSQYAALLRQVKSEGLLDRRRGFYVWKMIITGGLFLSGWGVFVALGDSWWQLLVAAFFWEMATSSSELPTKRA